MRCLKVLLTILQADWFSQILVGSSLRRLFRRFCISLLYFVPIPFQLVQNGFDLPQQCRLGPRVLVNFIFRNALARDDLPRSNTVSGRFTISAACSGFQLSVPPEPVERRGLICFAVGRRALCRARLLVTSFPSGVRLWMGRKHERGAYRAGGKRRTASSRRHELPWSKALASCVPSPWEKFGLSVL